MRGHELDKCGGVTYGGRILSFSFRIVNARSSLSKGMIACDYINSYKSRLDVF
jgi:hypothetical protein